MLILVRIARSLVASDSPESIDLDRSMAALETALRAATATALPGAEIAIEWCSDASLCAPMVRIRASSAPEPAAFFTEILPLAVATPKILERLTRIWGSIWQDGSWRVAPATFQESARHTEILPSLYREARI